MQSKLNTDMNPSTFPANMNFTVPPPPRYPMQNANYSMMAPPQYAYYGNPNEAVMPSDVQNRTMIPVPGNTHMDNRVMSQNAMQAHNMDQRMLHHYMNVYSCSPGAAMGIDQQLVSQPENVQPRVNQYFDGSGYRGALGNRYNNRARPNTQEFTKAAKKRKKPLSQNMPKRDWSIAEAQRALDIERDFNKRHRNPSLILKFPDPELNRDIVFQMNPNIESVHFQQPSTPRFCFVTLKEGVDVNEAIKTLSSIRFGNGHVVAELKNNREEDLVKGPEDIDPMTLYVGNLSQDITVDGVNKLYPKNKRVDIGFAKRMKHTRYAFVTFLSVDDAIEAFKSTHSQQLHSKSLIVRFRRLHGTVGLPGDPKPQNTLKKKEQDNVPKKDEVEPTVSDQQPTIKEEPIDYDECDSIDDDDVEKDVESDDELDTKRIKQEKFDDDEPDAALNNNSNAAGGKHDYLYDLLWGSE